MNIIFCDSHNIDQAKEKEKSINPCHPHLFLFLFFIGFSQFFSMQHGSRRGSSHIWNLWEA